MSGFSLFFLFFRSSNDDYCPLDQVDMIQDELLSRLNKLYPKVEISEKYKDNIS